MSTSGPSLPVTKPVSVLNKPLKPDVGKMFKALSQAVGHGVTGNWIELAGDAAESLSALGLESDSGQLAWLLIRRSLTAAIYELVGESSTLLGDDASIGKAWKGLDLALEESEVSLDRGFFVNPGGLPLLGAVGAVFSQWLVQAGLPHASAEAVAGRLPAYFIYALHHEWGKNHDLYGPITKAIDTPFTHAAEQERAWSTYYSLLGKQVDQNMFGESFSLRQVYVPLRGYFSEETREGQTGEASEGLESRGRRPDMWRTTRHVVVALKQELEGWVARGDQHDAVRVIGGGPGCGKSSFVKMLAAQLAGAGTGPRVLFVPLHQLDLKADLEKSLDDFVQATDILPYNPMRHEAGNERLLVIFDGLDELAMQGKVAASVAQQFVREVDKTVDQRNLAGLRLQVIISGREMVIQANASEWRKPRQVLNVLPYYLPREEVRRYHDPDGLLEADQRQEWWRAYGRAAGKPYDGLPKELAKPEIDEITTQPLLNYLVALSHARGKLAVSGATNLNEVYADLLDGVYERAYAGKPHMAIRDMKCEDFLRVLEEIGLAAWHGDGRTTTVREIREHCEASGLSGLLQVFQEGAEAGVTSLLTAFYFRQSGRRADGDQTFEFTHKSFGEYLAGLRIVRCIDRMSEELGRRRALHDAGWDERDCLRQWAQLCGPAPLDRYLFSFLCDEVRLKNVTVAQRWQTTLSSLVTWMLRNGMPMDIERCGGYPEACRQARNAEEALMAGLNACARAAGDISRVDWPATTSAGVLIGRLQGQRSSSENELILTCLSLLDLSACILYCCDLYGADLSQADLSSSLVAHAILTLAILRGATLAGADLSNANLEHAHLDGANLHGARLVLAVLESANLQRADLRGAILHRANLRNANLQGANLQGANLQRANLQGADLQGADLQGADLQGADLRGVNWEDANLTGAKGLRRRTAGSAPKSAEPARRAKAPRAGATKTAAEGVADAAQTPATPKGPKAKP